MEDAVKSSAGATRRSTVLAGLLSALVLLPLLGHKALTDWDEGIYAEVSREMLTSGWMVPHWNHQVWLEKPPLMLWITAALYRSFGVSEVTARLGSALSGLALVTVLHCWLECRRTRVTAWVSTAMLLACFGFLHICRVGEMDTLLSLGIVLSLIGLTDANEGRPGAWLLFWIGAAIAIMTKGAACTPLLIAAAAFGMVERWRKIAFTSEFWLGALIFLALAVPWHVAMYLRFGHAFVAEYLGLHVLSRAAHQIEGHHTRWWFYGKVLLVSAPPFALLYPFAGLRSLRTGVLRAFALFAVIEILFFSIVQTRLPHYIAPAYPAFAAITAELATARLARSSRLTKTGWIKLGTATAAICGIAVVVTALGRASLHSAALADGRVLPDNKDAIAVLRQAGPSIERLPGRLLVLRDPLGPINVDIFYARRPVQQVEIAPSPVKTDPDRYVNEPVPLSSALTTTPSLILLDKGLAARLPRGVLFTPIEEGRELELGRIQQVSAQP